MATASPPTIPTATRPSSPKGVFERTYVEVSRKVNAEGGTTSITEIEQPRLRLTVLRLDDYTFHTLARGPSRPATTNSRAGTPPT